MWKTASLLFMVLTIAIGGMLSMQWKAYSKQSNQMDRAETVTQELTVESSEKDLFVTQRIIGLTKGKEYKVVRPNELFGWTCVKDNGDVCESKDENPQTFLPDQNALIFQYTIPIQRDDESFFLNEWTTKVMEVTVRTTDVEIIDTFRRNGTWIAGAPLKGIKEKDLIDYYLFTGIGETPSLYWQPQSLYKSNESHQITYYDDQGEKKNNFQFKELENLKDFSYLSVVFTNQSVEQSGKGLMIASPTIKKEDLKRKLVSQYYKTKFNGIFSKEKWLLDVFTSYTAKLEPETEKGRFILKELDKQLSDEEMNHLFNQVNNELAEIKATKLDQLIYEFKGQPTRFFTLNSSKSASFFPFYYYDPRSIVINDKEQSNMEAIFNGNMMLYPFLETIKGLGFEATMLPDHEAILVIKDNNSYRFYVNQNFFIYNEEDYGLLENPLTKINGKYYISKLWVEQIFKVSIDEGEAEIRISM